MTSTFNIHREIAPVLAERGFMLRGKTFRGQCGELEMAIWLNPESRLKRVRTITVDCFLPGVPPEQASVYQWGQAYAAFGWGVDYTPETPRWPQVIVDDFVRLTLPFIDRAASARAIAEMILDGQIPPSEGIGLPDGRVKEPYRLAVRFGWADIAARAVAYAGSLNLDWRSYESLQAWARHTGVELQLRRPPFDLRHSVDRFLPLSKRRYV